MERIRFDKKGGIDKFLFISRQSVDRQVKVGKLDVKSHSLTRTIERNGVKVTVPNGRYWTLGIDENVKLTLERAFIARPEKQSEIAATYKLHFKEEINQ